MPLHHTLAMFLMLGVTSFAQPLPSIDPTTNPKGATYVLPPTPSNVGQFAVTPETPAAGAPLPPAPPAPAVTLLVLVPQDASPNAPIPYEIRVTNQSAADAGKVRVRMPLPEGTTLHAAEPQPTNPQDKELIWDLKTIPHGETRKIELKLKASANVSDVTAKAYVSYEFGQTVKTRLSTQKLKVTTELPKLVTTADEAITVRVRVANEGRVPVQNVKLTETISDGFEFHRDTDGDKTASPLTRTFNLGSIAGGMGKVIEFQVLPKTAKELLVRSNVDAAGGIQISDDAKVTVQDAKLKVELRGDPQAVDDTATFRMVVRNEGTVALGNVKVIGSVPEDGRVMSRTNGGTLARGQVEWIIPKLPAGESVMYKWTLQSRVAGRKTVRGEAASASIRDKQEVQTIFAGTAAVTWEQKFDAPTVGVDKQGLFTVKVTNSGSDTAKGMKLTLTLPDSVIFVQATPKQTKVGEVLTFEARDLKPGAVETYSVTFKGDRTGPAYFKAVLTGDGVGDKPLTSDKYIQITTR